MAQVTITREDLVSFRDFLSGVLGYWTTSNECLPHEQETRQALAKIDAILKGERVMDYAKALEWFNTDCKQYCEDDCTCHANAIRSALEMAMKVESGEYMLMQKATGKYFMEGDNISIDENGKVITARSEAATKGTRG